MNKYTCMFLACAATGLALSGCVPVVVTGAATTAGVVAAQERSAGNAVDDAGIKLSINNLYFNQDINDLFRNVNIHVTEGRVMLTGAVNKEETKPKAVELAWRAKGVREVIDEIQISPQSGVGDFGRDTWISGQIRTKILVEKNVRSINYNVEVVNGVVYLLGIAQDKDELDKVAYIASTTKYVKQVVSHVIMKDDPRRRDYLKQQEAGGRPSEERPSDRRYSPGGQSSDDRPSGGQPESQPYRPE